MATAPVFDAASAVSDLTTNPVALSHTCTGTDILMLVGVFVTNQGIGIDSVTYGGDAMTLVATQLAGTEDYLSVYALLNPSTGANDILVTLDQESGTYAVGGISFTDVNQSVFYNTLLLAKATSDHAATTSVTVSGSNTDQTIVSFMGEWSTVPSTVGAGLTHRGPAPGAEKTNVDFATAGGSASDVAVTWNNDSSWHNELIAFSLLPVDEHVPIVLGYRQMAYSGKLADVESAITVGAVEILAAVQALIDLDDGATTEDLQAIADSLTSITDIGDAVHADFQKRAQRGQS